MPVTQPVIESIVATPGLLLVQVPPGLENKCVVAFTHTLDDPLITDGNGLTVIDSVMIQPVMIWYVITAVPALTPQAIPDTKPIEAIEAGLLNQAPPDVASLK